MERDLPSDASAALRYEHAVPIKAGVLRFPTPGPSALKKKGLLGKAGEYFVKEARDEMTLLLEVSRPSWKHKNGLVQDYCPERVLWTWDADLTDAMDDFLRTRAPGMCRHTEASQVEGKKLGVCRREECSVITTEEMLMKYLKAPITLQERRERYLSVLNNYPVEKETVIFDEANELLQAGKLVGGGIFQRTFRHVGHSNGVKMHTFPLLFEASSSLEAFKNVLRPFALTARRQSTNRSFILKYIAHGDSDTLAEWHKAISLCLTPPSEGGLPARLNDTLSQAKSDEWVEIFPSAKISVLGVDNIQRKVDSRYVHDIGSTPEVVQASLYSPVSFENLFHYLVQNKNTAETDESVFDKCILGLSGLENKEFGMLKVTVDPENSSYYGNNKKRMLFEAETITELDKSLVERAQEGFKEKFKSILQSNFTKKMMPWAGEYADKFNASSSSSGPSVLRNFCLEKSYDVQYDKEGNPVSFNIVWSSMAGQSPLDGVTLAVSKVDVSKENVQKINLVAETFDIERFQKMRMDEPSKLRNILSYKEVKSKLSNMKFSQYVYPEDAGSNHKYEKVARTLTKDTADGLRFEVLAFINDVLRTPSSIMQKKFGLMNTSLTSRLLVQLAGNVFAVASRSDNIFVVDAAIYTLSSLMRSKDGIVAKQALSSFMKLVLVVVEARKSSQVGFHVLKSAMVVTNELLSVEGQISLSLLDAGNQLADLFTEMEVLLNPSQKRNYLDSLKSLSKNLKDWWFYGYGCIHSRKRDDALDKIAEARAESAKMTADIEKLEVAYLKQTREGSTVSKSWNTARYNVAKDGFIIGTKLYKFEEFRDAPLGIPSKYLSRVYISFENFKNLEEISSVGEAIKLSEYSYQSTSGVSPEKYMIQSLIGCIEEIKNLPAPTKTKLDLNICATGEKFFGPELVARNIDLRYDWAKYIVADVANGISSEEFFKHVQAKASKPDLGKYGTAQKIELENIHQAVTRGY